MHMSSIIPVFSSGDSNVAALLEDYRWITSIGGTTQLSYSFPSGSDTFWVSDYGEEVVSWSALAMVEQAQVRSALSAWSAIANITFAEVVDQSSSVGDLRFSHSDAVGADDSGVTVGFAYLPWPKYTSGAEAAESAGDVWLNNSDYSAGQGGSSYRILVHEIGHAIGLSHPHDGAALLDAAYDSAQYSIMSYNRHPDSVFDGRQVTTPMLYDIAAVQYLYGANNSYNMGDDNYQFATNGEILTIWDAAGNDTFDFSNQTHAVNVSLLAGEFSSVGYIDGEVRGAINNLVIAFDVVIENAIGSDYADTIVGNSADNVIAGGFGDDRLFGEGGGDIAVVDVAYEGAQIVFTDEGVEISSSEGVDSLQSIEAVRFSDGILNLLSGDLSVRLADEALVGRVASLYQAALDREPDTGGLNFWVDSYTNGFEMMTISQNFVDSIEFSERFSIDSNAEYLDTLYQNVLGRSGDEGGVAFWLSALDNGHSYAEVLLGFSDSLENQQQVAPLLETLSYRASDDLWVLS